MLVDAQVGQGVPQSRDDDRAFVRVQSGGHGALALHHAVEHGHPAAAIVVVHAPHRAEAFAALRAAVDAVKHRVPIWKEEFYEDGDSAFVQGCCIAAEEPCAQQTLRVHWYDPHAGCEETHTP